MKGKGRMAMFEQLEAAVASALAELGAGDAGFELRCAKDPLHGDLALNAAFQAARQTGQPPREIAAALAEALGRDEQVASASVAGGGFVNITLEDEALVAGAKGLRPFEPLVGARRAVVCAEPDDVRQRWSAEAMVRLGATRWEGTAAAGWGEKLAPLIGKGAPFGDATAQERAVMDRDLARLWAAKDAFDEISFFAAASGSFRPRLYSAVLDGQGAKLTALGLGALDLTDVALPELEDHARLTVLSQRGDQPLKLSSDALRAPEQANPAFLLNYAFGILRRVPERADFAPPHAEARQLLCHLGRFHSVARLAFARSEPHRVGAYLVETAHLFLAHRAMAARRGEKAIAAEIIHAAMIVFSQSFAILGATSLEKIT